jgi:hypothetical protein
MFFASAKLAGMVIRQILAFFEKENGGIQYPLKTV